MRQITVEFAGEISNPQTVPSGVVMSCSSVFPTPTDYYFLFTVNISSGMLQFALGSADMLAFCQAMGGLCDTPPVAPPTLELTGLKTGGGLVTGLPGGPVVIEINPSTEDGRQAYAFSISVNGATPFAFRIFGYDIYDAYQALLLLHNNWT